MSSLSLATEDVLKTYEIKWNNFKSSNLKEVYDSVCLKEGEMPDKDEFNSVLEKQYEKYLINDLRVERNKRLLACDWTQNKDVVMSEDDMNVWSDYRQSLRELPSMVELKDGIDINELFPDEPNIDKNEITEPTLPIQDKIINK